MKKIVVLVIGIAFYLSLKAQAQNCPNLDFSMGNFTNWQAYEGQWTYVGSNIVVNISPCQPLFLRHEIMDAQQLILNGKLQDEYCSAVPKVPTGFQYSAQLGSATSNGGKIQALEYTLRVDNTNSLLLAHFAFVLDYNGHYPQEESRFSIKIKDSLGNVLTIPCGELTLTGWDTLSGLACTPPPPYWIGIAASNWTTVGFSLEQFIGQTIKIYFETRGCVNLAHSGYAYFVAECKPMKIDYTYCPPSTVARLTVPAGFSNYKWTRTSDASWSRQTTTNQLVVNNPVNGEIVTCELIPVSGIPCSASMKIEMRKLITSPSFTTQNGNKNWCNKTEIAFTSTTVSHPNDSTFLRLVYNWGDGDSTVFYAYSGEQITTNHTFNLPLLENKVYVRLKTTILNNPLDRIPIGCYDEEFIDSLIITRPIADFTDDGHEFPCPEDVLSGAYVDFRNQSQCDSGQLIWHFEEDGMSSTVAGRIGQDDVENITRHYTSAGKYDVMLVVIDTNGCTDTLLKEEYVTVLGPKGSISYTEKSICSPLSVDFIPLIDTSENNFYFPDSLMIMTGDGTLLKAKDKYVTRTINYRYQTGGAYLPVYYLYKTTNFKGRDELCIIQMREKDSIYVVDLQPNFDIESSYLPDVSITFNNTSRWIPDYLPLDSLVWNFGNGTISNDINGTTTYNTENKYRVNLTMKVLNCIRSKSMDIKIVKDVGIVEANSIRQMQIYPNPTTGKIVVSSQLLDVSVEIYNVVGQVVFTSHLSNLSPETTIDISHLANGLYFLKVDGKMVKIVKEWLVISD